MATRLLPSHPHLEQLKRQAKEFLQACAVQDPAALAELREWLPDHIGELKLAQAQLVVARRYSFRSWPRLKTFVESTAAGTVAQAAQALREAIDGDRAAEVARLLDQQPELIDEHVFRSSSAYNNQRPLTYAAQRGKLAAVRVLLERGADPAADGYLAVARAAMQDRNLPILELLLATGIDPNIEVYHWGPLLLYPCECMAPGLIRFLLSKGADPNRVAVQGGCKETPLQMALGTYGRSPRQAECIEALIAGGARFEDNAVMDLHRNRLDALAIRMKTDPGLLSKHWPNVDYGATGERGLTPAGGTLLHIAAEFCLLDAAQWLIAHGANVNARAAVTDKGVGGQTPLFHAATQFGGVGAAMVKLLLDHGADAKLRAKVRGAYDRPDELLECSVTEYAARFPGKRPSDDDTLRLLAAG